MNVEPKVRTGNYFVGPLSSPPSQGGVSVLHGPGGCLRTQGLSRFLEADLADIGDRTAPTAETTATPKSY